MKNKKQKSQSSKNFSNPFNLTGKALQKAKKECARIRKFGYGT